MPRKVVDRFRIKLEGKRCVYCGELAGTWDHFPPKSYSVRGFIIPSCHECNSLAGTAHHLDFLKRAELVKDKLRRRYRKNLNSISWHDDEMVEMGVGLREGIKIWREQKEIAEQRIAWSAESYLASIDHTNDFVQIFVEADRSESSND